MKKIITYLKVLSLKVFCDLVVIADGKSELAERVISFFRALFSLPLIAFFLAIATHWYVNNQLFVIFIIIAIVGNIGFGGWMHWKNGSFNMGVFLNKTGTMLLSIMVVYFALEMVITLGGENAVTTGFRLALQVSTLLYPIGKICKNGFILSKGEYPPKWIMQKIYNFQENGDLKKFMNVEDIPEDKNVANQTD